MANFKLFASLRGKLVPATNSHNHHGAPAYELSPNEALAQLAVTGTFNNTFYANGCDQLDKILELSEKVDAEFLAKTAIYAFEKGLMKDMPALLLAILSKNESTYFNQVFKRVIRNGKMLRNFVQIMRSGTIGRKSLGTRPKRLVQEWLENASDIEILRANIGNKPSLADVIKMVHPRPKDKSREALYAYIMGKPYNIDELPAIVREFEEFKLNQTGKVPEVPFQMLTSLNLTKEHWAEIAYHAGFQMLRQNLNTFLRHDVFSVPGFTHFIAGRLCDENEIRKARVFPYQLMTTYLMADKALPGMVKDALQAAMEIALDNVPKLNGYVVLCPDVSGSMSSPITGYRHGATSVVRCIDVAALISAAIMRKNKYARIMPFEFDVVDIELNARDSIMTNAKKLSSIGGGGTNCSAPLKTLNVENAKPDVVIMISDNESWVDANNLTRSGPTKMMEEWAKIKNRNPDAKLICLDIQPYITTPAANFDGVFNIGGFSDAVFTLIGILTKQQEIEQWTKMIDAIEL
ncbi:RNA-binding protein [Bartonella sp. HY038]|uniref:vWA domain-containing protein n=1 Tax=Bartonella sp. HY038 TaxID=2759660 RepID=UPI0015FBC683|nr:RNA-binding protein [Bartonella sp. HY038]